MAIKVKKSKSKIKPNKSKSVKKSLKKPLKKTAKKNITKKPVVKAVEKKEIKLGYVSHYFSKVRVAVIKLKDALVIGDEVKFKGHTTDFTQKVGSMQLDHKPLSVAKKGNEIGLQVDFRVRRGDSVTKL